MSWEQMGLNQNIKFMKREFFNTTAEQIILGSCIMNNDQISTVADILESKHFYEPAHQEIWSKLIEKNEESVQNQVTLKNFFDSSDNINKAGGSLYLGTLIGSASLLVKIRFYANQIIELWQTRALLEKFEELKDALNAGEKMENVLDNLDEAVKQLDSINNTLQVFSGEEMAMEWFEFVQKGSMKPIATGIETIDRCLNGGFYQERLYLLGAASGAGKTFFSQRIMMNALESQFGVLFISMEMPKKSIFARFLSMLTGINSFRLMINNIFQWEAEKFNAGFEKWKNFQKVFHITEKSNLMPKNIEWALNKAKKKSRVDFVVIDYAQIMKLRECNFNEASLIKENVAALVEIAKKHKVAVLLLSQLTKATVGSQVGLGSLKGSGGLYEDADCVLAMWSDEDKHANQEIKLLKMEVLKNRDGLLGSATIEFDGAKGEFKEINI